MCPCSVAVLLTATIGFGDIMPSHTTIYNWLNEFMRGWQNLEDALRVTVTLENIGKVQKLVRNYSRITVPNLMGTKQWEREHSWNTKEQFEVSLAHLKRNEPGWIGSKNSWSGLTKKSVEICAVLLHVKPIYQQSPETKWQHIKWVFPEDRSLKVCKSVSMGKLFVCSFFDMHGHFISLLLQNQHILAAH